MKAIIKREAKPGVWMEDVPKPHIKDHEVLIKIKKTSICGTDVHIYEWDEWAKKTIPIPCVIGHEFAGVIAEVGKNVTGLKVGERVSGEGHITCGQCKQCLTGRKVLCPNTIGVGVNRDGCFAEYLAIPAENVFRIPDDITDEIASIFDPLGNAVHTALSYDLVGNDVLITGAGPIGIMAIPIVKKAGARNIVITDMNEYRLNLAQKMGATKVVNVKTESIHNVMETLNIKGFDVCLEMSGSAQALQSLPELATHGGHLVLLGILPSNVAINWHQVIFKMLTIKGIYGREIFKTWFQMSHMLQSGLNVAPVITHRFAIDDYQKAFETMLSGQSGKVVLEWT